MSRTPSHLKPLYLLLCASLAIAPAAAQTPSPQEQLGSEVESALLELGARDALGAAGEPLTVSKPAQVRYELGAVVDVRSPGKDGLKVLAITPGGAAERLELQPGDRLLAVNGTRFAGAEDPARVLERTLRDSGGQLRLQVARGGRTLAMAGRADVAAIPAYSVTVGNEAGGQAAARGCGYVTNVLGVPPNSEQVFEAVITRIDGRSTPLIHRPNRYRLDSGRHVLSVHESIKRSRLNPTQRRYIHLMQMRELDGAYKPLVIDVKPGTAYRIGARLIKDRLDRDSIYANEYWEPVVYEERKTSCGN